MRSVKLPLVLLSGMGADERVFGPQQSVFDELTVPKWIDPLPREELPGYAKRMAEKVAMEFEGPIYLGGASFGGMVAMEMARHLNVKTVFLIGSVRDPNELPLLARTMGPLAGLARLLPFEFLQFGSKCFRRFFGRLLRPFPRGLLVQFERADSAFLRWAIFAMLLWRVEDAADVPVEQIHGDRDWALPIRHTNPTKVVRGGGHVISLTHAKEVNGFLAEGMGTQGFET